MQIGFYFQLHVILEKKKYSLQHTNMHNLCRPINVVLPTVSRISNAFSRMQKKWTLSSI